MTEEGKKKKLVQKLHDWAVSQWNGEVTQVMKDKQEFPSFQEFVSYMIMEAEVTCNPITSFHGLCSKSNTTRKKRKPNSVSFHTQTVTETENHMQSKTGFKAPCTFYQDDMYYLHCCPEFKEKSLDET